MTAKRVLMKPAKIAVSVTDQIVLDPVKYDKIFQDAFVEFKDVLEAVDASKKQGLKREEQFAKRELAVAILTVLRNDRAMTRTLAVSEGKYLLSKMKLKLSLATILSATEPMSPRSRAAGETKKLQTLYVLIASAAHRLGKYSADKLSFEKSGSWYESIGRQATAKLKRAVTAAQVKALFADAQRHVRKSVI